jgi:hypothetical protein
MFGLYYIPESPPWLVYNEEEDLAFKSMAQIRLGLAHTSAVGYCLNKDFFL